MLTNTQFSKDIATFAGRKTLDFYLCGHLKKALAYLALIEHENTFFVQVKPSESALGPLKGSDSPFSDVSKSTLTRVGETLST
jgi:hypothetical protein